MLLVLKRDAQTLYRRSPTLKINGPFYFTEENCIVVQEKNKIFISFIKNNKDKKIFQSIVPKKDYPPKKPYNGRYLVTGELMEELAKKTKHPLQLTQAFSSIVQLFCFRISPKKNKFFKAYIQLNRKVMVALVYIIRKKNKEPLVLLMKEKREVFLCEKKK